MIPNIVKGRGVSGALAYAMGQGNDAAGNRIEIAPGEKSRAELLGGQNFGFEIDSPERLELARRVMEWQALPENQAGKTRKLERDCFHASLSWGDGQQPTRDEMIEACESFLKAVGLEKAKAVFVAHDDTDHRHCHIVASRIDPETGRSLTLDNDFIHGQAWAARWERDHGQELPRGLHGLMDALDRRDAGGVVDYLTRDKATFQPWEVNRALAYADMGADERAQFRTDILGQANVIGLRETAELPVTRYTTREVLAAEMAVQRNAGQLAKDERHGLTADQLDKASAAHTLKPEQDAALRHLGGAEGFAILWGEAGTGKSHTLNAARAAHEAAGKTVIGLAWTNDVAQQMRGDGFKQANTIASELLALEKGRTSWGRDTVLIVDEAAMLSTATLAQVTAAARQAGAKLVLAGDDKQLSSIERGGLFETLRQTHGAAVLKDVQRVQDAGQKDAFGRMHEGDFAKALSVFEKAGSIHWSEKQADTLKEMATRYTADVAAEPDKRRFMFAYTNKDVDRLNDYARALHQQRGHLGDDHTLATKHGEAQFAEGDRIQFTGNGRTKDERNAGLVNGRVGSVTAISVDHHDRTHMTVEMDTKKDQQPQRVSFVVGEDAGAGEFNSFKHGYAGTIYRGQGRTLDEVYVGHSAHWRSAASYVALTRHRESVHIFAARETVGDIEALAHSMARADNRRAATAYHVDAAELVGLEQAITTLEGRQASNASERSHEAHGAEPATGQDHDAGGSSEPAFEHGAGEIAGGLAVGAGRVVDAVADYAEQAIEGIAEGLASLLGGGSSAPAPKQPQPRAEPSTPSPEGRQQAAMRQAGQESSQRRHQFLRDFDREVTEEGQRDAEIGRDRRGRDGGRERQRGE